LIHDKTGTVHVVRAAFVEDAAIHCHAQHVAKDSLQSALNLAAARNLLVSSQNVLSNKVAALDARWSKTQ
jgi:hypothetical protein